MMIILLRLEQNMEGWKNMSGCVNQVDEEHNRGASIFLLINRLKINVPVRFSQDTFGGKR